MPATRVGRSFAAQYAGRCCHCGDTYSVGMSITNFGGNNLAEMDRGRYGHTSCYRDFLDDGGEVPATEALAEGQETDPLRSPDFFQVPEGETVQVHFITPESVEQRIVARLDERAQAADRILSIGPRDTTRVEGFRRRSEWDEGGRFTDPITLQRCIDFPLSVPAALRDIIAHLPDRFPDGVTSADVSGLGTLFMEEIECEGIPTAQQIRDAWNKHAEHNEWWDGEPEPANQEQALFEACLPFAIAQNIAIHGE